MRAAIDYTAQTTTGSALVAGSVLITDMSNVTVTIYANDSGLTTLANPQTTGTNGRISGYLPTGTYKFVLNGTITTVKEVVAGTDCLPATSSTTGTIQLAGALAGTATSPSLTPITDTQIAAANKDGLAATPSLRTLGAGATQARAGNTTLDQVPAPTASVSLNTHTITNVVDPVNAQDAATKNYVDTHGGGGGGSPATTIALGTVQLAGDLGGTGTTATAPVITNSAVTISKIAQTVWSANAIQSGLDVSKPAAAAGNSGFLYFSTDKNGGTLFRSNGTSWVRVSTGLAVADTPVVLTDAATITTDVSTGHLFRVVLGGNRTLANPTNPIDGQRVVWEIIQDTTGSRTITLGSQFTLGTDIPSVTLSTGISKRDFLGAVYNAGTTKWYVTSLARGY